MRTKLFIRGDTDSTREKATWPIVIIPQHQLDVALRWLQENCTCKWDMKEEGLSAFTADIITVRIKDPNIAVAFKLIYGCGTSILDS